MDERTRAKTIAKAVTDPKGEASKLAPGPRRRTVHSPRPQADATHPALGDDGASVADATQTADPSDPDLMAEDGPTDDLDASALKVALNRPISLADVRKVQQRAYASEATHVGPSGQVPPETTK